MLENPGVKLFPQHRPKVLQESHLEAQVDIFRDELREVPLRTACPYLERNAMKALGPIENGRLMNMF